MNKTIMFDGVTGMTTPVADFERIEHICGDDLSY